MLPASGIRNCLASDIQTRCMPFSRKAPDSDWADASHAALSSDERCASLRPDQLMRPRSKQAPRLSRARMIARPHS